jgi:hypothetical protein
VHSTLHVQLVGRDGLIGLGLEKTHAADCILNALE